MGFYDLSKPRRTALVAKIKSALLSDLRNNEQGAFLNYFRDEDTYIRKAAYLNIERIYLENRELQSKILEYLRRLSHSELPKVRQTAVNAAGEIGKTDFDSVQPLFDRALFDEHHSVRNAVIGSLKKMGQKNPQAALKWAATYLKHEDKEVRREICHGIELRGRTHPQDILDMLKELQFDETSRVRNTLIHVLGQISYKKGCLETVVEALNHWENKELIADALDEIVDVHRRYKDFAARSQESAMQYISDHYKA
ncbi:HEAT repeat domain-containing protein [Poritiphilus flavus]|uniref:HEAT repeat domain-containing protein n=1 Tax=Poritiphilus flavus TaxID=2697053 RepID=A0A6L9E9D6_9FLAO|nr:HEAT repeat domain-containing protein [Poritiphilus flavus]NAS11099.1 HEAT repeat domain-containing protein [Poritiphilus flavus]